MSETTIQQEILDLLGEKCELYGLRVGPFGMFWRNNTGALKHGRIRFGLPGSPDIVGIVNGRYVGIEVKQPKQPSKTAKQNQDAYKAYCDKFGGLYRIVDNAADALEWVRSIFRFTTVR